jgi:hypothetical protein
MDKFQIQADTIVKNKVLTTAKPKKKKLIELIQIKINSLALKLLNAKAI